MSFDILKGSWESSWCCLPWHSKKAFTRCGVVKGLITAKSNLVVSWKTRDMLGIITWCSVNPLANSSPYCFWFYLPFAIDYFQFVPKTIYNNNPEILWSFASRLHLLLGSRESSFTPLLSLSPLSTIVSGVALVYWEGYEGVNNFFLVNLHKSRVYG